MDGEIQDFSRGMEVCVCARVHVLSHAQLFATPWTVAHQVLLSMEFSKQEYWNGLPFPTHRDLSNPGIETMSLASPTLAGRFFTTAPSRNYIKNRSKWLEMKNRMSDMNSVGELSRLDTTEERLNGDMSIEITQTETKRGKSEETKQSICDLRGNDQKTNILVTGILGKEDESKKVRKKYLKR